MCRSGFITEMVLTTPVTWLVLYLPCPERGQQTNGGKSPWRAALRYRASCSRRYGWWWCTPGAETWLCVSRGWRPRTVQARQPTPTTALAQSFRTCKQPLTITNSDPAQTTSIVCINKVNHRCPAKQSTPMLNARARESRLERGSACIHDNRQPNPVYDAKVSSVLCEYRQEDSTA